MRAKRHVTTYVRWGLGLLLSLGGLVGLLGPAYGQETPPGTVGQPAALGEAEGLSQQAISPVRSVLGAEHQVRLDLIPWETRSATDLDARDRGAPELDLWMRTQPADPALAPALATLFWHLHGATSHSVLDLLEILPHELEKPWGQAAVRNQFDENFNFLLVRRGNQGVGALGSNAVELEAERGILSGQVFKRAARIDT